MSEITSLLGTMITFLFGALALLQPSGFSQFLLLNPQRQGGVTEIRASYGGWFLGFACFALWHQDPMVFKALAFAWLGTAFIRFVFQYVDNSYTVKSIFFIFIELMVAALLYI